MVPSTSTGSPWLPLGDQSRCEIELHEHQILVVQEVEPAARVAHLSDGALQDDVADVIRESGSTCRARAAGSAGVPMMDGVVLLPETQGGDHRWAVLNLWVGTRAIPISRPGYQCSVMVRPADAPPVRIPFLGTSEVFMPPDVSAWSPASIRVGLGVSSSSGSGLVPAARSPTAEEARAGGG